MWEQGQEGVKEEIVRHQITELPVNQYWEPVFTESLNYGMPWVGRDLKDHLATTPLPWAGMPPSGPGCPGPHPSLNTLNASRDGASTTFPGRLFQCLTTF